MSVFPSQLELPSLPPSGPAEAAINPVDTIHPSCVGKFGLSVANCEPTSILPCGECVVAFASSLREALASGGEQEVDPNVYCDLLHEAALGSGACLGRCHGCFPAVCIAPSAHRSKLTKQFLRLGYERNDGYLARKALEVGVSTTEVKELVNSFLCSEVSPLPPADTPEVFLRIGKIGTVVFTFYTGNVLAKGAE